MSKLKDNLSAYLRKVRAGATVVVYDRDVPIACIERIVAAHSACCACIRCGRPIV